MSGETAVDRLLRAPAFGLKPSVKKALLLEALNEEHAHHFAHSTGYRRFCERRHLTGTQRFEAIEDLPFLPVHAFKLRSSSLISVDARDIRSKLESSATSGVPSQLSLDKVTSRRQVRALGSVMTEVLGAKRRPFIVFDVKPQSGGLTLGARSAAVSGMLHAARSVEYVMTVDAAGAMVLDRTRLTAVVEEVSKLGEPVVLFGFTYVLYLYGVMPISRAGQHFALPAGSQVLHIGGWKKLEQQRVEKVEFNQTTSRVFGLKPDSVIDVYGFTEQMGVLYPDGTDGLKRPPAFAEVIVRDPHTLKPVADGTVGLLQFVTPLPHSYPGISILTDDLGVIVARGDAPPGAWSGTQFRILGRAARAEIRGCGDILGEKTEARLAAQAPRVTQNVGLRLLWDARARYSGDVLAPLVPGELPEVTDFEGLTAALRTGREALDRYSVDELVMLVEAAAARWSADTRLVALRQQGLGFLVTWCSGRALRARLDLALQGRRGYLDRAMSSGGTNRRLLFAAPRGVAVHWLAGNVPTLGMFALIESLLTRNANVLKAPSAMSGVLPVLLDAFRGLEVSRPGNRVLRGDDLLKGIAVVYCSRDDRATSERLSRSADIRIAWGGREAVEAIVALPRNWHTEDVVFGPKLSMMIISRESLQNADQVRRLARRASADASAFDQYACASPHTIFVEQGGEVSPKQFAQMFADEMGRTAQRVPLATNVEAGTSAAIAAARIRYELEGEMWSGPDFTVLFDEQPQRPTLFGPVVGSRVVTVKPVVDVLDALAVIDSGVQTVGLAVPGSRRSQVIEHAARAGAARFPDVGKMTEFDDPWDGMFLASRLVRWVSAGGPL